MTYSIVIADDHKLIAEAITDVINTFREFNVLYTVQHGKALIEHFKQPKNIPDIVLLDINMPLMDGCETAEWLRKHHPEIFILALTTEDNKYALGKMIRAGASGYVVKNENRYELEKALVKLVNRQICLPDWVTRQDLIDIGVDKDTYSRKEEELFKYLATDLTYEQIGKEMCMGTRAVEVMRDTLFKKTAVRTRAALVAYGFRHGLIS